MLKVEINQIVPTPSGLRFGLVVRYSEQGPVRFAEAVLPWRAIAKHDRVLILREFNRVVDEAMDTEPLF